MLVNVKIDRSTIAKWFHALSDETRLRIIEALGPGERCVCELTDLLDSGQSRLSFHLKTLKDAGLLHDRRDGRWIYYSLNADTFTEMEQCIKALHNMSQIPMTRESKSKC
jgi:ArsR family transcriptional regulator